MQQHRESSYKALVKGNNVLQDVTQHSAPGFCAATCRFCERQSTAAADAAPAVQAEGAHLFAVVQLCCGNATFAVLSKGEVAVEGSRLVGILPIP